jgi:ribose transport system substrate-binding protein
MLLAVGLASAIAVGCGSDANTGDAGRQTTVEASSETGRMLGPSGEESTPSSEVQLTDEEIAKLEAGNYTAAVSWHDASSDLPRVLGKAIRERFAQLGIELAAIGDAQFDAAKQRNDIESLLARRPDALISIPVDPVATAPAYREAVRRGTKLVFLSNVPAGFTHGKDYVGIGSADQISTGENTAKIMCDAVSDEGKIGMIFHDAEFFITNQRDAAFRDALEQNCPGVRIAAEEGFEDPARVEAVASAMITRYPDLSGIYTTWSQPAEGVLAALRQAGRSDVKVVTVDLSQTLALDMAKGGPTAGVAADKIVDSGRLLADLVAYGLLGKSAPAFAVVPGIAVTPQNLLEGWQGSYGEPAPRAVQEAAAE